jgi:hypothetical protein
MTRLERIRRDSHGLDESKAITSEVYVPLASEPIGRWPTGRNRLVLYCARWLEFATVPITTGNGTQYHFFWPVHHSFDLRFWVRIQKLLGLCAFPRL